MQYYNKILVVTEIAEHKLMDCADLTDRGMKCFCNFRNLEFTTDKPLTEEAFEKIKDLFCSSKEVGEAEIIILNGEVIYDRNKYKVLSDGQNWLLKSELIELYCGENK